MSWIGLAGWMALAALLRFWHLDQLPPWTDELATMVFALGHSFLGVPLDQWIDSATLLEPLRVQAETGLGDVTQHLFNESTHPPLYFLLAHGWVKAWAPMGELLPVGIARSLPALLGILSVPSAFGLSWVMGRGGASSSERATVAAQLSAALMAVSPLNVFWAREARHYTLVLLLVMASLACFVRAVQSLQRPVERGGRSRSPLSWPLVVAWSMTNALGVATHYFFVLSVMAQGCVLLKGAWTKRWLMSKRHWLRILLVALATAASTLVWLPSIIAIRANPASQWIASETGLNRWLMPPLRLLMWSITFLTQLPAAISVGLPLPLVIVSMVVMVGFVGWLGVYLYGLRQNASTRETSELDAATPGRNTAGLHAIKDYLGFSLLLFLAVTYFAGQDLSQAPRFTFVFYGAAMVYLGALLERGWRSPRFRRGVVTILLVALMGSFTVLSNTGYLQHHRPDVIATLLQANGDASARIESEASVPTLIATTHQHHGQTGRMMGIALDLRDRGSSLDPQYFLAHRDPATKTYDGAIAKLTQQLSNTPVPFDLWLLNFRAPFDPEAVFNCAADNDYRGSLGEYRHRLYRCR